MKTINIMRPFYSQNNLVLKIFIFIYPSILLVVCIFDVWYSGTNVNDSPKCGVLDVPWDSIVDITTIGQGTARHLIYIGYFALSHGAKRIITIVLPSVQFILPCLIVLVCMVLQMIYIKKAFRGHKNSQLNAANQVNLTVFLISFLYLSSVFLYSVVTYMPLYIYYLINIPEPIVLLLQLTIPLINAAMLPTILILRKPELRARYKNYIAKVLFLPCSIYGKVHYLALRRRGYTDKDIQNY